MRWDYSIQRSPSDIQLVPGEYHPYGVKIIKTLYDDSDQILASMDATPEEARVESEEGFIQEFVTETKTVFSEQLDYLFSLDENDSSVIKSTSHGSALGRYLTAALSDLKTMTSVED